MEITRSDSVRDHDRPTETSDADVQRVQTLLNELSGSSRHPTTGALTGDTREAIARFQRSEGLAATGEPNQATVVALQKAVDHVTQERRAADTLPAIPLSLRADFSHSFHRVEQAAEKALSAVGRKDMSSSAVATSHYPDVAAAKAAFATQSAKLGDVGSWTALSGPENAKFDAYDAGGAAVHGRSAKAGDFVRVQLPAQPSAFWVRVEDVSVSPDKLSLRVRPSYDPTERPLTPSVTAHFFTDKATNTFSVERHGADVEVRVEGRHESANTGPAAGGLGNAARNRAIAEGAWGLGVPLPPLGVRVNGMQQHQWNCFTENLARSGARTP